MIEPLIVVEGNLRLPTVRLLTNPSLYFGFEWSPLRSRPAQSQSEIPLFAARFETAYVPAIRPSGSGSSYRAVSVWGVYGNEGIPRAALNLLPGQQHVPEHADQARVDPIRLSVGEPMVLAARKSLLSRPVVAAIAAAAGTMFIAWLLFGYAPRSSGDKPSSLAESTTAPAPIAQASSASSTSSAARRAEAVATAQAASSAPAVGRVESAPTVRAAPVLPRAVSSGPLAVSIETRSGTASPKPSSARARKHAAVTAHTQARKSATKLAAQAEPAARTAKRRKNATMLAGADVTEQRIVSPAKAGRPPRTTHAARRWQPADERIAAVESAYRARTASNYNDMVDRPPKAPDPISPAALYAILQHSPTLDSNAPASGTPKN